MGTRTGCGEKHEMENSSDMLQVAVSRRLQGYGRDIVLHSVIGVAAILIGVTAFVYLWLHYRSDDTELVSQLAGGATSLVAVGLGGFLGTKVLSVRDEIRAGREWLYLYQEALGPPPNELLKDIKSRILNWLEG